MAVEALALDSTKSRNISYLKVFRLIANDSTNFRQAVFANQLNP